MLIVCQQCDNSVMQCAEQVTPGVALVLSGKWVHVLQHVAACCSVLRCVTVC